LGRSSITEQDTSIDDEPLLDAPAQPQSKPQGLKGVNLSVDKGKKISILDMKYVKYSVFHSSNREHV